METVQWGKVELKLTECSHNAHILVAKTSNSSELKKADGGKTITDPQSPKKGLVLTQGSRLKRQSMEKPSEKAFVGPWGKLGKPSPMKPELEVTYCPLLTSGC